MATLSLFIGYRFGDWLRIVGFDLKKILTYEMNVQIAPCLTNVRIRHRVYCWTAKPRTSCRGAC